MQKTINGATLRKMLITSYSLFEENKNNVDALNVFPVPDGDTGTNMTLTLKSAVTEMNACDGNSIESLCVAFNRGALKGARGNSGVILSQILKIGNSFFNVFCDFSLFYKIRLFILCKNSYFLLFVIFCTLHYVKASVHSL